MNEDTNSSCAVKEAIRKSEIYRQMVRHENDLINHRMGWLLQFEGFLFAALALAVEHSRAVVWPLTFLGIAAAFSCGQAMKAANLGITGLKEGAKKIAESEVCATEPAVLAFDAENHPDKWRPCCLPWTFLPRALIGAWVVVLIIVISPTLTPLKSDFNTNAKPGCHAPDR